MLQVFQNGLLNDVGFPSVALAGALAVVISVFVPYLLGSINSAVFISRVFYGADIRTQGSGNGGLTNMLRVYGKKAALFVLLGDVLKTALSIFFVGLFYGMQYGPFGFAANTLLYVAGTFCIIGHIFPVYFKFRGGKGVLCTAAMVLILSPIAFAVLFLIFLLLLAVTHYVSLSSITVGLLYPFVLNRVMGFCGIMATGLIPLLTILVGLLIFYCHRTNIVRLKERRENRFYFSKSKRAEEKARKEAERLQEEKEERRRK